MRYQTINSSLSFQEVMSLMFKERDNLIKGEPDGVILLVEHDDVYTKGRSSKEEDLLHNSNIPIIEVERGGRYTYHGKGQRVIYPIIDIRRYGINADIKKYVNLLLGWVSMTFRHFGIKADKCDSNIGLWINSKNTKLKIASLGIKLKKYISYYGISVNLNCDLSKFNSIKPCGFNSNLMTSSKDQGVMINFEEFDDVLKKNFSKFFKE